MKARSTDVDRLLQARVPAGGSAPAADNGAPLSGARSARTAGVKPGTRNAVDSHPLRATALHSA